MARAEGAEKTDKKLLTSTTDTKQKCTQWEESFPADEGKTVRAKMQVLYYAEY